MQGDWMVSQSRCSWTHGLIEPWSWLTASVLQGHSLSASCVNMDTMSYPTAVVQLQIRLGSSWRVVVAPELPVVVPDLYCPVKKSCERFFGGHYRSAKRKSEQDAVVSCEISQEPMGKMSRDQPVTPGAEQPTADREILEPRTPTEVTVAQTPTEPEMEVTGAKGRAQEGGDKRLQATVEELKAWQHSDHTLEKARSYMMEMCA